MSRTPTSSRQRLLSAFALTILLSTGLTASGRDEPQKAPAVAKVSPHVATTYELTAGLDGEIFPAFANYASLRRQSDRRWGTFAVRVDNNARNPFRPEIVLVPGHAYVAVRVAPDSRRYLYIETALTGRTTFENAVASAQRSLSKFPKAQVIRIDVWQALRDGIYPMPVSIPPSHTPGLLQADRKSNHSGS